MRDQIDDQRKSWKFSEAKARFSEVVQRALDGEPQCIIRGGRDVVVVVAEDEYRKVTQPRRSLVDLFSALRGIDLDLECPREDARETRL